MPRRVLIEVLAAEVSLTDDMKLGIEWAVRFGEFVFTNAQGTHVPSRPPQGIVPGGGSLDSEVVPPGFSSPSIITAENRKAIINVSTSVRVVTTKQVPVSVAGSTGNSITQTVVY